MTALSLSMFPFGFHSNNRGSCSQALDTLGSIRWRINTRLLEVVETIWANGESIGDMVEAEDVSTPSHLVESSMRVLRSKEELFVESMLSCGREGMAYDRGLLCV